MIGGPKGLLFVLIAICPIPPEMSYSAEQKPVVPEPLRYFADSGYLDVPFKPRAEWQGNNPRLEAWRREYRLVGKSVFVPIRIDKNGELLSLPSTDSPSPDNPGFLDPRRCTNYQDPVNQEFPSPDARWKIRFASEPESPVTFVPPYSVHQPEFIEVKTPVGVGPGGHPLYAASGPSFKVTPTPVHFLAEDFVYLEDQKSGKRDRLPILDTTWGPQPLFWLANEARFYFTRWGGDTSSRSAVLYELDAGGRTIRKIGWTNGLCFLSPDGKWILWESGRGLAHMGNKALWVTHLVLYNIAERVNYVLTDQASENHFIRWG